MSPALQKFDALQHYVPLRAIIPTSNGGEYVRADEARKLIEELDEELARLRRKIPRVKPLEWKYVEGTSLENCLAASAYGTNHLYVLTRRAAGGMTLEIHQHGHFAGRVESSTAAGCDDYAQAHHRKEIEKFFETSTPGTENPPVTPL